MLQYLLSQFGIKIKTIITITEASDELPKKEFFALIIIVAIIIIIIYYKNGK